MKSLQYFLLVIFLSISLVHGKNFCERFNNHGKDDILHFTNPDMADIEFGTQQQFKSLHCCVKGYSHMMWYKDNKPYPWKGNDPDETFMEHDNGNQTLTFLYLLDRNSGYYTCVGTNGTHNISHTKELLVKPATFTEKPFQTATPHCQDVMRLPGDNVTFYCEFYFGYGGSDDRMLYWVKMNKTGNYWIEDLDNSTYGTEMLYRDKNETMGTYLYITNIKSTTYATYLVTASNQPGSVEVPVKLTYGDPDGYGELNSWLYLSFIIGLGIIILMLPFLVIGYCRFKLDIKLIYKYNFRKVKDTGDKKYDIFISHSGSEKDFPYVKYVLMKYLENKYGFKLCVEERDFLAGNAIADNVVESIEDSRSCIIVLTPDYLTSNWSPFQFNVALERSLKLHNHLIIIIARELPSEVDMKHWKSLKHVIGVTRSLKWKEGNLSSQEKFWKKLLLQLPKSPKGRPNVRKDLSENTITHSSSEQNLLGRQFSTSGESGYSGSPTDDKPWNPLAHARSESVESQQSAFTGSQSDITVSVEEGKMTTVQSEEVPANAHGSNSC
ncbi:X-linked interleukin-1 receptor accessory protein-like 2 [Glandiceps talaboti]